MIENNEVIVVFPEFIEHRDMANRLVSNKEDILSAGFCHMSNELNPLSKCYGESASLCMKSREDDSRILQKTFGE